MLHVETDSVCCSQLGLIFRCRSDTDEGVLYISETIHPGRRVNVFVGDDTFLVPDSELIFSPSDFIRFIVGLWCFLAVLRVLQRLKEQP